MKLKIEIKNRWTGSILFEYESENNSIKKTLLEAIRWGADLRGAYLLGADLRGADLQGAYLQGAYLYRADLQGADLYRAYLQGAYLYRADLRGAYLLGADLRGADLQGADLRGADLYRADLRGADLQGADLRGAYLQGAYLQGENILLAGVFTGLYKYYIIAYYTEKKVSRIKMGCHDRTVEEWDADFWNNNNEFPNDNSFSSNQRLLAYNFAKQWLEMAVKNNQP